MSEQQYEPITDFTTVIQTGDEFRYSPTNGAWLAFIDSVGQTINDSLVIPMGAVEFRRPVKPTPQKWVVFCGDDISSWTTENEAREQCEIVAKLGPAYYGILKGVCRSQVVWGDE